MIPVSRLVAVTVAFATDAPCGSCAWPANIARPALWPCAPCAFSSNDTTAAAMDAAHSLPGVSAVHIHSTMGGRLRLVSWAQISMPLTAPFHERASIVHLSTVVAGLYTQNPVVSETAICNQQPLPFRINLKFLLRREASRIERSWFFALAMRHVKCRWRINRWSLWKK